MRPPLTCAPGRARPRSPARRGRRAGHHQDEADAHPILYLAFSSDRHDDLEVTDIADRLVQDRPQVLPGVAEVRIFEQRRYAMRIWLDPARLAVYGMTTQDVEEALRRQNVELLAGRSRAATGS